MVRGSVFLLTPLREGRLVDFNLIGDGLRLFLLTPLREGRLVAHRLKR